MSTNQTLWDPFSGRFSIRRDLPMNFDPNLSFQELAALISHLENGSPLPEGTDDARED